MVLQRGWVTVGEVTREGAEFRVRGRCIRSWSETSLAALAAEGPAKCTLEEIATEHVHELTVVKRLDCDAAAWREALDG